tara:strand:- start:171 stop:368 length:198 start_codon:yes stop_codon:yes gene_type:complete
VEEFVVHGLFVLLWKRNGEFSQEEKMTMIHPFISIGTTFKLCQHDRKIENEIVNRKNPLNMVASG